MVTVRSVFLSVWFRGASLCLVGADVGKGGRGDAGETVSYSFQYRGYWFSTQLSMLIQMEYTYMRVHMLTLTEYPACIHSNSDA